MTITDGGFGIIWLLGAFDVGVGASRKKVSLGICRATKQLAFFSDGPGAPLLMYLSVIEGRCTEGNRCLYANCPSNRTTWSSYRLGSEFGRGVRTQQGFEGLKEVRRQMHLDLISMEDYGNWVDQMEDEGMGYCIELSQPLPLGPSAREEGARDQTA